MAHNVPRFGGFRLVRLDEPVSENMSGERLLESDRYIIVEYLKEREAWEFLEFKERSWNDHRTIQFTEF